MAQAPFRREVTHAGGSGAGGSGEWHAPSVALRDAAAGGGGKEEEEEEVPLLFAEWEVTLWGAVELRNTLDECALTPPRQISASVCVPLRT